VVPLFKRQLAAGGPVTVTHPDMQRYFMTIPEAVQLVLLAGALPEAAGRISILDMGKPVRIVTLAEQLIRLSGLVPYQDVPIVFTGLRPGEKLNEELVATGEATVATTADKIRIVHRNGADGPAVSAGIDRLVEALAASDFDALMQAVTTLVPEYTRTGQGTGGTAPQPVSASAARRPEPRSAPPGIRPLLPQRALVRGATSA
jgi:FlaA1/EpsC-like NDP-sugar epimerase